MAPAMIGMQVIGMLSSAIGAKAQAEQQKLAYQAQAQMDLYNAKTTALSLTGAADLGELNAQSVYNTSLVGAEFAKLDATKSANDMVTRSAISSVRAAGSIASLQAGAQIDDNNALLNELQAQSSMLRGEQKEQDTRMQFAMAKSKATATMAKGNIDLGQGAALSVRAGHDLMAENTAIRIQQATLMDAFGQRTAALNNQISASSKRAQAGSIAAASAMESALAISNANYTTSMANANYEATKTLAAAGLLSTQASLQYKRDMGQIMLDNSSVSAMLKGTMADAINPNAAFATSLIGGAGQVANSWYMYSKNGP